MSDFDGHDRWCEAELISEAGQWTACRCADRGVALRDEPAECPSLWHVVDDVTASRCPTCGDEDML